jgi:hypothetical protein
VACDPLNYSGVDAGKWESARQTISSEYGMNIGSEAGEESKSGFKLRWSYDPSAQTLEIQCIDKPFLIPCGVVNGKIGGLAEKCGISAAAG